MYCDPYKMIRKTSISDIIASVSIFIGQGMFKLGLSAAEDIACSTGTALKVELNYGNIHIISAIFQWKRSNGNLNS